MSNMFRVDTSLYDFLFVLHSPPMSYVAETFHYCKIKSFRENFIFTLSDYTVSMRKSNLLRL